MQKVDFLRTYILPKFTYGLILATPSRIVLRQIDKVIRTQVKEILHLPTSISSNFLYRPRQYGRLGLLVIEKMILIPALRAGLNARESSDPLTREIMSSGEAEQKLAPYAKGLRLNWPVSLLELDKFKQKLCRDYIQSWVEQKWQGDEVEDFANDPVANKWLSSNLVKPSREIDAMKMRTNTYPTRTLMNIVDEHVNPNCCRCNGAHETLGHILGKCLATKNKRIKT